MKSHIEDINYDEHVTYVDEVRIPRWLYEKMLNEIDRGREAIKQRDEYFDLLWSNLQEGLNIQHALNFANALCDYTDKVVEDTRREMSS